MKLLIFKILKKCIEWVDKILKGVFGGLKIIFMKCTFNSYLFKYLMDVLLLFIINLVWYYTYIK